MLGGRSSLVRRIPVRSALAHRFVLYWTTRAPKSCAARQLTTSINYEEDAGQSKIRNSTSPVTLKKYRRIRTLDPSRLVPADHLDFSARRQPRLGAVLQPVCQSLIERTPGPVVRRPTLLGDGWSSGMFPPGTRGFLYYHVPLNCPPLAGQLRFRITSSSDPATFAAGLDLLTERGMPWMYPLYKVVERDCLQELVALLLQDGLVSQKTIDVAKSEAMKLHLGGKKKQFGILGSASTAVLGAFGQEFELRLTDYNCTFVFAGANSLRKIYARAITGFVIRTGVGHSIVYSPFEGSAVCCFERSTLPEHEGKRVAVIRVKRFLNSRPVKYVPPPDGRDYPIEQLRPREGALLMVIYHRKLRPWAADVDKRKGDSGLWGSLRILFENEGLYGPLG